jgi:hypothetical protein
MRRLVLAALVLDVPACSTTAGSSAPPPSGGLPPAGDADGGANFASPPGTDDPQPAKPGDVPPELAEKIKRQFGEKCRLERTCGDLLGIDCDAAVDGPYYYVRRDSLEVVSRCGGYCMSGTCTDCPPKAWTCPTY